MNEKSGFGLSLSAKAMLMARLGSKGKPLAGATGQGNRADASTWSTLPLFRELETLRNTADRLGVVSPYFRVHDGIATGHTSIAGRPLINYASYDYLGLNGHPKVIAAATEALACYGTTASASRLVSGERPPHGALEQGLADYYGVEDAVCFVSGHATNVTVIGQILTAGDLILHDELIHNSAMQGAILSGARRYAFRHNDPESLESYLKLHREQHKRALISIEGHYSMDGDIPDLPRFIELARRYRCWLMVDEAHGLGVLGPNGGGIADHFGIAHDEVDIWMGTLSKTLVSCGGYIAGKRVLTEYLKYSAPGFVYSVGMQPATAASARAALDLVRAEPERGARLRANATRFLEGVRAAGLNPGTSIGAAIVPVILGSSVKAARLAEAMFGRGVNVQPIIYPAVPERAARLRFFLSAAHTDADIDTTLAILTEEARKL
jgi:8-amino-7-oxononanoate synthase